VDINWFFLAVIALQNVFLQNFFLKSDKIFENHVCKCLGFFFSLVKFDTIKKHPTWPSRNGIAKIMTKSEHFHTKTWRNYLPRRARCAPNTLRAITGSNISRVLTQYGIFYFDLSFHCNSFTKKIWIKKLAVMIK